MTERVATKAQIEYALQIPKVYRATYLKAIQGKSPRAGIKAKCQNCTNFQRNVIKHCTDPTCSLLPYRPYQKGHLRQKALVIGGISKEKAKRVVG